MKRILITGKNSYIGDAFENWIRQWPDKYEVTKWNFRDDSWRERDFSQFDSIFNVAGIAHNSSDKKLEDLYYKVNRDLAIEIAKKAKSDGVKQYIHMSSIIVYGSQVNRITRETPFNPDNFYGDSKVQAELGLNEIADKDFKIAIIRPPMIYGKNSKGNYPLLAKFAKKTPIFFDYENKRSMLHIDHLAEMIRLIILNQDSGVFYPQNKDYVMSKELVKEIAKINHHKIYFISFLNPIITLLIPKINVFNKVFGSHYYDLEMGCYEKGNYQIHSFSETIELTEKG